MQANLNPSSKFNYFIYEFHPNGNEQIKMWQSCLLVYFCIYRVVIWWCNYIEVLIEMFRINCVCLPVGIPCLKFLNVKIEKFAL